MDIANRLRQLREWRHLSQGDIEERTGLLRVYISRIENGHTVPSIETLEKISRALEVPMYQLFLSDDAGDQEELAPMDHRDWSSIGVGKAEFRRLRSALTRMSKGDRALLMFTAAKMIGRKRGALQNRADQYG